MSDINKDDLADLRDEIIREMTNLFQGVYKRQDTTNGRVRDGEILSAQYGVRLKNLERELFTPRSGRRRADPVVVPAPTRYITDRDVRVIVATLVASSTAIGMVWKVLPLLLKALTP